MLRTELSCAFLGSIGSSGSGSLSGSMTETFVADILVMRSATIGSCARSFYVRVLGFQRQPRPPFPFGGAWLTGGGLTLHLIDDDPTIPHALGDWRVRRAVLCAVPSLVPYFQSLPPSSPHHARNEFDACLQQLLAG